MSAAVDDRVDLDALPERIRVQVTLKKIIYDAFSK